MFSLSKIHFMRTKFFLIVIVLINSCSVDEKMDREEYLKELNEWKKTRLERLKSDKGWLNLAGLYWLEEGENTIGSDSSNTIVFPPEAPAFAGKVKKEGDSIYFDSSDGTELLKDSIMRESVVLKPDATGDPTLVQHGSLAWYIIKRDSLYGIRLRDYDHPRINDLDHIPYFEPDLKWRKTASFIPFEKPDTIQVPTVIGIDEMYLATGKLIFRHDGKKYELLPFKSGKGLFLIIGDKTSAIETYAAGRFMYTDLPDKNNEVILDFNKAYNPPCAFSPHATCPLPPHENRLNLRITAGEKAVHLE